MTNKVKYEGRDLEAMSFAVNYHKWILSIFKPHLGRRVIEVGAGTGLFSELLLNESLESLSLVEPSVDMHAILEERIRNLTPGAKTNTYNALFSEVATQIRETHKPDSIVYVNVLEHIPDDVAELQLAHNTLDAGGRVFIFVPALQSLLGSFDKQIGHFRRYRLRQLEELCKTAGFKIVESRYMDFFGIAPWWIKFRLLRSSTIEPQLVDIYDRFMLPIIKPLEASIKPPVGKNILLVAERTTRQ